MSFIVSKGSDAINDALQEKQDFSKALVSLSGGKTYKVRALSDAVVKYFCHSVYGVFYSTPCTKPTGKEDLYDKAVDMLYKDAKAAEEAGASEAQVKAIKDEAYALKAKERYMIGFINLKDGQPMVLDFTSKQGKQIVKAMEEYKEEMTDFSFKVSKSGKSNETVLNFDIIVNPKKGLTDDEQGHFTASAGHEFDFNIFENVLQVNDEKKQLEDLHTFGFDVTRLGFEVPTKKPAQQNNEDNGAQEPQDDDF